jgi:hypothetical protein
LLHLRISSGADGFARLNPCFKKIFGQNVVHAPRALFTSLSERDCSCRRNRRLHTSWFTKRTEASQCRHNSFLFSGSAPIDSELLEELRCSQLTPD